MNALSSSIPQTHARDLIRPRAIGGDDVVVVTEDLVAALVRTDQER